MSARRGTGAVLVMTLKLPIPAGAAAYISLKVPRGAGPKAMRAALATMMTRSGPQHENQQP
jgi:hypothetical protein